MKGMKSAKDYWQAPPPAKYLTKIVGADATFSKAGSAMIKLRLEVRGPEQYAGAQTDDYIITDGNAKGGGMGKKKLRGLGIDVDSSDAEVPDSVICQQLLGLELWVDFGNEQQMTESVKGSGNYDKEVTAFDAQLNREVQINKLIVLGYFRHPSQGVTAGAPQGAYAPQGAVAQAPVQQYAPQAPQGYAPQQYQAPQQFQAPPQQFAPQGAPQGYPQAPQGYAPQGAPQGYAQQAPQQFAPQAQPVPQPVQYAAPGQGAPNGAAVPPWVAAQQAQGAPQGAPAEAGGEEGAKRGRKKSS